jgi:hypothetical protein
LPRLMILEPEGKAAASWRIFWLSGPRKSTKTCFRGDVSTKWKEENGIGNRNRK